MELFAGTLGLIGLLVLMATALGVVFPSVFRNRSTGAPPKRSRVFFTGAGAAVALFALTGVLMPATEATSAAEPPDAVSAKQSAPDAPAAPSIAEQPEAPSPEDAVPADPAPVPPAPAQSQAQADPEEKSRECSAIALTYTSAVKARHVGDPFDGLYASASDMAKFVVTDGDAAKLARIETALKEVTREVQTRAIVDEKVIRALSTHGFEAVVQDLTASCRRPRA